MTDITVQKTSEDAASKALKVTIPVERVLEAQSRALKYYQSRARLPGFRPGKAPEAVVRKRFNDAIRQTVLEELIREGWETARTAEALKPIADPSIRNVKFEEGSDVEFDLLVEVRPELTLERTGGFTLRRQVAPVTDEQVGEQLARLQEQKAAWVPVEGTKPAEGNLVRVEATPIDEQGATTGEAQSYDLILGREQAAPALEEKIMELLPGETAEAEIRSPDDHPDESRRGQTRRLRVTLHDVKRQELPPLDDAFARELGDFENLDALRAALRRDLEAEAAREADANVREQLMQQLIEANAVPAPESLVHRLLHGYANMYKVPEDQLPTFETQFHPMAEQAVRRDLVLEAVVEANGLRATESELDERVAQLAATRNVPAGQLYASLQKSNRLAELEHALTEEKAFGFLLQQSTVEEATA